MLIRIGADVIQYNLLNLLKDLNSGTLKYEYSSTGEKLRKVSGVTTTDYIGNFVCEGSSLAYILTSEGRIVKPGNSYLYEYNLKDHLGNTRVSFSVSGSTPVVLQNQDYYPFGMAMNTIQNDNRYLYNGKELQDNVVNGDNLDWYDYGARMYDTSLGRWHVIDPMAEDYHSQSPYHFSGNNPMKFIDGNGMNYDWFQNELTGNIYYNSELRKGDESQLGGGWVHLGGNGIFSNGTPIASDAAMLYKNSRLTETGVTQTLEYDKPMVYADAEVSRIKLEASFKGKNAERFMSGQGYDKKPSEANIYSYSKQQGFAEPNGTIWQTTGYERTEKVNSWRYIPKGVEGSYNILGYYGKRIVNSNNWKTNSYTRETWERRRYDYNRRSPRKSGVLELLFWEILKILPDLKIIEK